MSKPTRPRGSPSIGDFLPLLQRDSLGFFYGRERSGDLLAATLQEEASLLILGAVGTGKTILLASILRQLYAANGPQRLQVSFIDYDRGLSPLFEGRQQTRKVTVRERDFMDALALPLEEADRPGAPYQLLLVDEVMYLAPHGPFQEQWSRFQEILARLAGDEDLRQRFGVVATSIIGTEEMNARFSTTIYIPRDFPFSLQQHLEGEPRLERLVRKHRQGNFFIKRRGQQYSLFRMPFFSMKGPSYPDLLWEPDR
jgi:hypothetical protein